MSVTAPKGFLASGVHAGIRRSAPDLAAFRSTVPAVGGAMFSRNQVQAAPLLVDREHVACAEPQAVVVNSGVANSATGERGQLNAFATAAEAGRLLGLPAEQVSARIGSQPPPHELQLLGYRGTQVPPQHRWAAVHAAPAPHWQAPPAEQVSARVVSHMPPHEVQLLG